jgi:hypothetical protein
MQCLKIELHAVTAVTAVTAVVMAMMVAAVLYLLIEINESRKTILRGDN